LVARPPVDYINVVHDIGTIVDQLSQLLSAGIVEKGSGPNQNSGVRSQNSGVRS
jgi:hypothetical protein